MQASTHARPSDPQFRDITAYNIEQFLKARFKQRPGKLAIKYGKAPAGQERQLNKTEWYTYPNQCTEAAQRVAELAQDGYDVGYCVSVFRSCKVSKANALPATFAWADDLHASQSPIKPSVIIQTSAQKPPQLIFEFDRELSPSEREQMSRAIAYAGDADKSGWDCTQVLRFPDTYNHKHAQRQHVTQHITGIRHNADLARMQLAAIAGTALPHTGNEVQRGREATKGWQQVDVTALLDTNGKPRRIPRTAWVWKLWGSPPRFAEEASPTDKRSGAFYQLVSGLMRFYPPAEAMALAMHHGAWGHEDGKPRPWLETDGYRCIGKLLLNTPLSGGDKKYLGHQDTIKRPRGRPAQRATVQGKTISATAKKVLDAVHILGVGATNAELVAIIGRSERTIQRALDELEEAELIKRHQTAFGRVINLTNPKVTQNNQALNKERAHVLDTPPDIRHPDSVPPAGAVPPAQSREALVQPASEGMSPATPPGGCVLTAEEEVQPQGSVSTGELSSHRAPRPSLAQAVREAIDAYGSHFKRVLRYLVDNFEGHDWTPAAIKRAYEAERDRRKRTDLLERIRSMSRSELRKAIRSAEYHIGRSHERQDKAWRFWLMYRNRCESQLQALINEEQRERRNRRNQEPPAPACLFAEAEIEPRPAVEAVAPSGGCVPPQRPEVRVQPRNIARTVGLDPTDPWIKHLEWLVTTGDVYAQDVLAGVQYAAAQEAHHEQ